MVKKILSIVVPVYNEEEGIETFIEHRLLPELIKISENYNCELILVNDGSSDNTLSILQKIYTNNQKRYKGIEIKVIALSRNFGKEVALSAGFKNATGDAVFSIDADGQQPPEIMESFIKSWVKGNEIIIGVRDHYTKHGLIPKLGSKLFYKILHLMGNKTTVEGSTDFRLIDREVIDQYNKLTEHNRITRGLIDWMGYKKDYIKYIYGNRQSGKPSYNFSKLFKLAIDSFISMSTTPLTIFGYLGSIISIFALILGLFCIINQYILNDPLHLYWDGSVQMTIFITFLIGLVMISQYITSLYVSHIHAETQNRPLYIISKKESRNLESFKK